MIGCTLKTFGVPAVRGEESYVNRVIDMPVELADYAALKDIVKFVASPMNSRRHRDLQDPRR